MLERGLVLCHLFRLGGEQVVYALQHLGKAGSAETRIGREVGAAPERLGLGRQEHRQRPAPVLAQQRQRVLVDGVDIGALLAIDLDVHVKPVH